MTMTNSLLGTVVKVEIFKRIPAKVPTSSQFNTEKVGFKEINRKKRKQRRQRVLVLELLWNLFDMYFSFKRKVMDSV